VKDLARRPYYGWGVVAASLLIIVITFGIHYSFGVFFESLENEFGWTRAQTSGVFSAYMLLFSFFGFVAGLAADKFNPRIVLTLGGFLTGLGLFLTSRVSAPWQLYLSYSLMVGIGASTAWTPLFTTTSQWFSERRTGLALGIIAAGMGLGTIILAPVASHLISAYGWSMSYLVLGVAVWVIILPLAQLLRKKPQGQMTGARTAGSLPVENSGGITLRQALRARNLWLIYLMYFLWMMCEYAVLGHLVRYAIDMQIDSSVAATFLSVLAGSSIAARVSMGSLSDRIGRKLALVISGVCLGAPMFWLPSISSIQAFYVFSVIFGFGFGAKVPVVPALIKDIFGLRHMGAIYGSVMIFVGLGAAGGPLLAGHIHDLTDSYFLAFVSAGIMSLVAVLVVHFIRLPGGVTGPK